MKPVFMMVISFAAFIFIGCGEGNSEVNSTDTTEVIKADTGKVTTPIDATDTDTSTKKNDPAFKPISDLIIVEAPSENSIISSPLQITGKAVGYWFFEADFPVRLYDANDSLLATAIAMAKGEWMTENFVPYSATMKFTKPATKTGKLVFEKSNPSGLEEHERSHSIPVQF
jgi:hypothetical protein